MSGGQPVPMSGGYSQRVVVMVDVFVTRLMKTNVTAVTLVSIFSVDVYNRATDFNLLPVVK